ncbi:hypothetical protein [Paraburkholderia silvatlantica]|uniref:hypothetical protein n=1 Tax=Paraburkholderia silvatlantica TaxID=321895 RepID=UPI0037501646
MSKERYDIWKKLHDAEGKLAYMLAVFGDTLAEREGYKELDGMDAVHFYVVHKMKWAPAQVRAMSAADLRFVLTEEMSGWTAPVEAR